MFLKSYAQVEINNLYKITIRMRRDLVAAPQCSRQLLAEICRRKRLLAAVRLAIE